jgi:hypothetical protein
MATFKRNLIFLLIIVLFIARPSEFAQAQTESTTEHYFSETGFWVKGEFYKFYQSAAEPLLLFGYPISDEFTDQLGQKVQYFQRARFELVEDKKGVSVQITPLGELLHSAGAPLAPISTNSQACRLFPESGKSVCYAFLPFYDTYNGAKFFGPPISDVEVLDGRYVQYFRYARLEWRPEQLVGQRVALTDLGRIYYDMMGQPGNTSKGPSIPNRTPTRIQARAFVAQALIPAEQQQTVYIIVQDEKLTQVEGALVSVEVTWPNGQKDVFRAPASDSSGISQVTFNVTKLPVKEVARINVSVEYQGMKTTAETWFRIWW